MTGGRRARSLTSHLGDSKKKIFSFPLFLRHLLKEGLLRCRRNFNVAGMEVISFHGHLAFYNCEDVELAWRSS